MVAETKSAWLSTRENLINEILRQQPLADGVDRVTLDFSLRGNVLYALFQNVPTDESIPAGEPWIAVIVLKKNRGLDWTFTMFSEFENPEFFNCPLKFLTAASTVLSQSWRAKVDAQHQSRRTNATTPFTAGDKVLVTPTDGPSFTSELIERSGYGWIVDGPDGKVKVKAKQLTRV